MRKEQTREGGKPGWEDQGPLLALRSLGSLPRNALWPRLHNPELRAPPGERALSSPPV